MSDGFEIRKATRKGVTPLIGFFSESGCGKTYSSLLLARGFVGPEGKIGMIDTESGRGELYADVIPGGYDVLRLDAPFSPQRYIDALTHMAQNGYSIVIVDSISHEWEGPGGVLDMAGENEEKSGKSGLHNWKTPKMEHTRLVSHLLRAPMAVIVCMRAKFKTRQVKNEQNRTVIVKDDHASPIQAEDFIYEMMCHGEIMPDHSFRLTKSSHPGLRDCFPQGKPISTEHGKSLAAWCSSAGEPPKLKPAPAKKPAVTETEHNAMKRKLWDLTKEFHDNKSEQLEKWLHIEALLGEEEELKTLTTERLSAVVKAAEERLKH